MKNCTQCNQEYKPKNKNQRFCCKDCHNYYIYKGEGKEANNKQRREYKARRTREDRYWRKNSAQGLELWAWYEEIKTKPCTHCGQILDPFGMEFDHREGEDKKYNIASMFSHNYSRSSIEKELIKCDLLCIYCHRIKTKERRPVSKNNKHIREMREWIEQLKQQPCADCSKIFPSCCMDFDHVRGEKVHAVSTLVSEYASKEAIQEEIDKCELVCAYCHRLRTQQRLAEKELGEYVPRNP